MKFNYKWPTAGVQDVQQQILVNKKSGQEVNTSDQTIAIGSATIVFYFLTLTYIYGSALFNQFVAAKHIDISGSVYNVFKTFTGQFKNEPSTFFRLNTLSASFEHSEKIGTTLFVVIFMALLQALFSYQNIYSTDPKRSPIIAFNYIIILCWLLFMFIFPSRTVGKLQLTSWPHTFLAFCVLLSLIINCFLIANLYSDYFDEKAIEPLTGIGYAIIGAAIFALISMMFNAISDWYPTIYKWTHSWVALAEILCLVLYGIFMIMFIQFPPVPDGRLSCVLVPESNSLTPSPSVH